MTDIVKRLRGCGSDGCNPYAVAIEAADEIERLRQQVQNANDHADAAIKDMELMREALERVQTVYQVTHCHAIARAALEESK